jgi:hypothetical protein
MAPSKWFLKWIKVDRIILKKVQAIQKTIFILELYKFLAFLDWDPSSVYEKATKLENISRQLKKKILKNVKTNFFWPFLEITELYVPIYGFWGPTSF